MTIEGIDVPMDEDDWAADTAAWQKFTRGDFGAPRPSPQRVSVVGRLVLRMRRAVRRGQ